MYYLDTNTCIHYLNGWYPSIREGLLATAPKEIAIPALVKEFKRIQGLMVENWVC